MLCAFAVGRFHRGEADGTSGGSEGAGRRRRSQKMAAHKTLRDGSQRVCGHCSHIFYTKSANSDISVFTSIIKLCGLPALMSMVFGSKLLASCRQSPSIRSEKKRKTLESNAGGLIMFCVNSGLLGEGSNMVSSIIVTVP